MKNLKVQLILGVICLMLGFMISIQFKSVKKNDALMNQQFKRADELQKELDNERENNEKLYKQLLQYEKDLNAMREAASKNSGYAKELLDQLNRANLLAGLTDVVGTGIIVTLNDSKVNVDPSLNVDQNYFVIHDEDILMVINELSAAGAEAISLNNERVLATSEIRCAGPTVSINNTKYGAPFVIKAIGNPDTLEAALNLRGGVKDILQQWGIELTIKKSNEVKISRYNGVINFKYASPLKEGE